jgi:hypothetical protein
MAKFPVLSLLIREFRPEDGSPKTRQSVSLRSLYRQSRRSARLRANVEINGHVMPKYNTVIAKASAYDDYWSVPLEIEQFIAFDAIGRALEKN